jgi:TPR repeat protein
VVLMEGVWSGIASDRVVAVVARLDTGLVQIGSGYLVTGHRVLTARHCAQDQRTGRPAVELGVSRRSGGPEAPATLLASGSDLDVAVLAVGEGPAWVVPAGLEPPRFGRVDRSHTGELRDCQAVGFPLWQLDPKDLGRNAAELHGTIRVTEDVESGLLVMRDPELADVTVPGTMGSGDPAEGSPWGGLSGALVFWQGIALGVVIEHHPRQGGSSIRILPVERFAAPGTGGDADIAAVAATLGLPPAGELPLAGALPTGMLPLAGLVEVPLVDGRLPRVAELDPYTLGATPSGYGSAGTYGERDRYVLRTKDELLAAALRPGRLVMLVGPSKAGKTRTAFEVLRGHDDWAGALLAAPEPKSLGQLAGHPALGGSDPLVIWLDDLQRFLPPAGELSLATISRLADRPGPTVLLATLRTEQRARLRGPEGELSREVRVILDNATSIELASTRDDPGEQARAVAAYPQAASRPDGLAEILAGAPELLRRYREAAAADPPLHMLVETCVDWARCAFTRPIPEPDLLALARDALEENRPDLDLTDEQMDEALRHARTPIAARGQVALLGTRRLSGRSRGYEAFDYLVAADDGQDGNARPVAETTWWSFLDRATDEDASGIGFAAWQRDSIPVAVAAGRRAAQAGDNDAQVNLALVLITRLDPPELAEARAWLTRAAEAGNIAAQSNLGLLLSTRLDPPELAEARTWLTRAAEAGPAFAQYNLGLLLANRLDPPELAEARTWWTRAAEAGDANAQHDLGLLLFTRLDPPEVAEARTWLTKGAEAGHTDAQVSLGALLAGWLTPPELAEARTWWTKAAEAGHIGAQFNLGLLLANQLDPPEVAEARTWYTRAAEAGHTDAQHNLGLLLANQLDPPELAEAYTWWTRAAEAGHPEAQYCLGQLLEDWLNPPELAEARAWWTKAAEAGHTGAQYRLGRLLATGLDPPELAEARAWWTKAAEAGDIGAQVGLGMLLEDWLDPPELTEAYTWWTEAAGAGHTGAQYHLGQMLATRLDPPELAEARTWYTKAAEAGHTGAQNNLGVLLATRLDPPELAEARTWLTRAANAGDTDAQGSLGMLLATMLDPPEVAEARTWWTKAAEAGHTDAQSLLGLLLAHLLDPPELAEARGWYTKAAEAGNTDAQVVLGLLLTNMLDPPEVVEARTWYTRAAEAGNTDAQVGLGLLLTTMLDPPEVVEARAWWTRAAQAGNTEAQVDLGWLLATMLDPPELAEARTWYSRAAEAGNTAARDALALLGDS